VTLGRADGSVQHRTFVNQRGKCGPGQGVQHHDDIERIPSAPRRSIADVLFQFAAQHIQPQLNVPVRALDPGEDGD
jgi:hypothetical protein